MTIPSPDQGANALNAFEPWQLGPLVLRNRIIKAATNEGMARGGLVTDTLIDFHRRIAAGGAALSTLAYCAVSADGRTFDDQLWLRPQALDGLRRLTDAVHAEGGAVCAQITHGGAFNFLNELQEGRYPAAPSGGFNPPGAMVGRWFRRGMDAGDLERVARQFADAACLARDAGFDAVEIHMGHGYLLSQFLSPLYNKRRDVWGGDAAARARFPREVLARVLDAVGQDMAVLCKISMVEGHRRGASLEDKIIAAQVLEEAGAHMLVLSAGMNVEAPWTIFGNRLPVGAMTAAARGWMRGAAAVMALMQPRRAFEPLYLLPHARRVRASVSMPLAYLGGVTAGAHVATAMAEGFQAVAMGRALVHDAALVQAMAADPAARSGCIACNLCVKQMYSEAGTHCVHPSAAPL